MDLKEYESDPVERCKLILQECIYVSDIEYINVWFTKLLLCLECRLHSGFPYLPEDGVDETDQYSLSNYMSMIEKNSHNGDSLTLDIKELWNIDGFDAIIENPPYNEKNKNGKTVQGKNKLYSNFMKCDLERLVDKGHLVYVTPLGWITGYMNIYSDVIKYNMEYINFNKG